MALVADLPHVSQCRTAVASEREPLRNRKASGLTMIVAEQNVRFVSGPGDRVYILEKGMVRYHGSMTEFLADDEVRQAYLAL